MAPEQRRIGCTSAVFLIVGNMVGAGVFTTSGFALADLGDRTWVLVAWVVGGILAMCGALCYGALARSMPESGGEYLFLSRIFHPLAGFFAGWVSLLAGFTAPIAAAALGFHAYLSASTGSTLHAEWIASGAIVAAMLIHGSRLKWGLLLQNTAIGLKLILIVAVVFIGMTADTFHDESHSAQGISSPPEVAAFAVVLIWVSFAYSGWNAAVYVAGEIRNPRRNLHRALLIGTASVTLLYLALNWVFLYAAPVSELSGKAEIGAVAAYALGGAPLQQLLAALVALALFTSIVSMTMTAPRVYARMAQDGLFPALFSPHHEVPREAILLQAALAVLVVWISELAQLLSYIGFTLGISSAATVIALVVHRHRLGSKRVPVPGYPWIPALFVVTTLSAALFMIVREPMVATAGLATVLIGIPFYMKFRP